MVDLTVANSDLDEFLVQTNLLGADVIVTDHGAVIDVLNRQLRSGTGSVGVTTDVARQFPSLRSDDGDASGGVDVALSCGRLGIAHSGSVLIAESMRQDRTLHMLCRKHVIVLSADRIVPTMLHAGEILRNLTDRGYRYFTFVSGPSRTADIEKILTIGAHGPAELLIVLVRGWMPDFDATVS